MAKKTKNLKGKRSARFEGLPVVDAPMDIDLVISKKDVANSTKKNPASCAAALAGRRELKTDVRVYLTRTYVKDEKKQRWIRFITPESITKEIVSFDRGAAFEPGEYVLKAPTTSSALGYRYKPRGPHETTRGKKQKRHVTANVRISAKDKMVSGRS